MTYGIKFLTDFQQHPLQWPKHLPRGNGENVLPMALAPCFSHRHPSFDSFNSFFFNTPILTVLIAGPSVLFHISWASLLETPYCSKEQISPPVDPSDFLSWLASWQKLIALLLLILIFLVLFWRCQKSFAFSMTNNPFMVYFYSYV